MSNAPADAWGPLEEEDLQAYPRSSFRRYVRWLAEYSSRNPLGAAGGVVVVLLCILAVAAPLIAPWPEEKGDFLNIARPPTMEHLLGTDHGGRDVLSRVVFGTRRTLMIATLAVVFGTSLGAALGIVSGYFTGKTDLILQRLMEIMQAFPDVILALLLLAGAEAQPVDGDRRDLRNADTVRRSSDPFGRAPDPRNGVREGCRGNRRVSR